VADRPTQRRGAATALASAIERVIDAIGRAILWVTLAMILLVATNVLLRYSLSLGSVWAQELEWHLLAALILFGMSYALQRGDNVRVDLFYAHYTPRTKRLVDIASALLTLAVAIVFIKLSWAYVGQSFSIGEKSADPGGIPWRWLLKSLIPAGFALLALQALAELIRVVTLRSRPV
jgi:TRAP-type mannitol/chloroaromatic compound transport system permease small subunit